MRDLYAKIKHFHSQGYSPDMTYWLITDDGTKVSEDYVKEVFYELDDEEQDGFIDYSD
jgi:hypothetical protein